MNMRGDTFSIPVGFQAILSGSGVSIQMQIRVSFSAYIPVHTCYDH